MIGEILDKLSIEYDLKILLPKHGMSFFYMNILSLRSPYQNFSERLALRFQLLFIKNYLIFCLNLFSISTLFSHFLLIFYEIERVSFAFVCQSLQNITAQVAVATLDIATMTSWPLGETKQENLHNKRQEGKIILDMVSIKK